MKVTGEDLRTAWRQDPPDIDPDQSTCLSEMEWARLLAREASEPERVRAAEHIGSCSSCADELNLLSGLRSWETQLAEVFPPDGDARPSLNVSPVGWLALRRIAWVAAAVMLLAVTAIPFSLLLGVRRERAQLAAQLTQQQQALDSTRAALTARERELGRRPPVATGNPLAVPHLDIPVLDLDPREAGTVRGSSQTRVARVDQAASIATLILSFPTLARRSILEAQLVDAKGEARWVGRSERDRLAASVTLAVPVAVYPPGQYEIRLFDVTRGRTRIGTYLLEVGSASRKDP